MLAYIASPDVPADKWRWTEPVPLLLGHGEKIAAGPRVGLVKNLQREREGLVGEIAFDRGAEGEFARLLVAAGAISALSPEFLQIRPGWPAELRAVALTNQPATKSRILIEEGGKMNVRYDPAQGHYYCPVCHAFNSSPDRVRCAHVASQRTARSEVFRRPVKEEHPAVLEARRRLAAQEIWDRSANPWKYAG